MTWSTVYFVCFLFGLGLSVVSFVSGLDRITFFDNIFGHAHHGIGHGHAAGHGRGAVHGHVHHGHGQNIVKASPNTQQEPSGHLSPVNMTAITAFVTWFGGAGYVLQHTTALAPWLVAGGAGVTGLVGGAAVNAFMRMLVRGERTAKPVQWMGTLAQVTMPIRKGGTGEIVFTHDGTRQVAGARSDRDEPIDKGMEVIITRYDKGIAYVCTWDELEAITPQS
jgi:hypothetical protein